jgi:hypothetical protein
MKTLLSTGAAASALGVSRERVGQLLRSGVLRPAARDSFGRVFLSPVDVRRLAEARQARRDRDAQGRADNS